MIVGSPLAKACCCSLFAFWMTALMAAITASLGAVAVRDVVVGEEPTVRRARLVEPDATAGDVAGCGAAVGEAAMVGDGAVVGTGVGDTAAGEVAVGATGVAESADAADDVDGTVVATAVADVAERSLTTAPPDRAKRLEQPTNTSAMTTRKIDRTTLVRMDTSL